LSNETEDSSSLQRTKLNKNQNNNNNKFEILEMEPLTAYNDNSDNNDNVHNSSNSSHSLSLSSMSSSSTSAQNRVNRPDDYNLNNRQFEEEKAHSSPMSHSTTSPVTSNTHHVPLRQVKIIVVSFGIRLLFSGLLWDHYVHKYHDLLMEFSTNPTQRV
jgi:hypothetical protein